MGWLFGYSPSFGKEEQIARFRESNFWNKGITVLRDQVVGQNYWALIAREDGTRFIWLAMLRSGGKGSGWGYKDMSENSGPCELNCPLSFLREASPAEGYAIEWRENVRKFHAERKVRKDTLARGSCVQYGGRLYSLDSPAGPRKGWNVTRDDGQAFRMKAGQLARAAIVPPSAPGVDTGTHKI